ncbi:sensor histidine kinase [Usitatibacter palustris]|uniref:histidine kinase n=1 Tax=Usitatibacter palustris TaxID=2732487 RepID=A0A6M4H7S3_9PROT|nr:sensor histidine kinase [Usitatibacter palustris]QJR14424.1 Adaptive-response sensory-kinase SasA [Usitatibacter palustris]
MLQGWVIVVASFGYIGLLFAIAYYADKRAEAGRSIIANPVIYSLSLAVYATAWTFYGSVGRAASDGVGFLPIYIGPTLMILLWWFVVRKMIRISKINRITSLADFVASRYGKSALVGGLVTVIAVIGILPYISLQLKAVSSSFQILLQYPDIVMPQKVDAATIMQDTAFYVALFMALFTIAFGTRQLDVSERHEGMVAAIAFESIVKLVAFTAVGVFVTFGMYDGVGDIFGRAAQQPELAQLMTPFGEDGVTFASWVWLTLLSMLAIVFLPRQFQVAVIENVDEKHLRKAVWLFPLYMIAINLFVLPIAFGGRLAFPEGNVDADTFVLTLPMAFQREGLALLVFIGGLSAATGMVIVETIALSTMVCNDLVMPILLRWKWLRLASRHDISSILLDIRRAAIVAILLLGYFYFRIAGEAYALVSIGLISFAAVAQFAPAIIGGLYWKGGTRIGALAGLTAGFLVWLYTLLLPAFAKSGWLGDAFLEGPFGIDLLRPSALFGLTGLDQITHAMIWSMVANVGAYMLVSLLGRQSAAEHSQATLFVDVFSQTGERGRVWRGTTSASALQTLLGRFLGPSRAAELFLAYANERGHKSVEELDADAQLVHFAEIQLAGTIGAASAHTMVATVAQEEPLGIDEVMTIIDEASQVIAYSHQLEEKQQALESATTSLKAANERLQELDRLKDDFITTVTHELRTPLTSIRAFSEILHDYPDIDPEERHRFLGLIIKESERLTRLINQVLDLAKLESGLAEWRTAELDVREIVNDAVSSTSLLFKSRGVELRTNISSYVPQVLADRDRLMQVMLNLLSNAVKFCPEGTGQVQIDVSEAAGDVRVVVQDNGIGIDRSHQAFLFEKFRQVGDTLTEKPAGTGLGLAICRQIVDHFGGRLWVESEPGRGSAFSFTLPAAIGPSGMFGSGPSV